MRLRGHQHASGNDENTTKGQCFDKTTVWLLMLGSLQIGFVLGALFAFFIVSTH